MKKRDTIIAIICLVIILISTFGIISYNSSKEELVSVKSEKQLLSIYNSDSDYINIPKFLGMMPLIFLMAGGGSPSPVKYNYSTNYDTGSAFSTTTDFKDSTDEYDTIDDVNTIDEIDDTDYSSTNIQVKNVDEADVIKTDGKYIYSISGKKVIITNAKDAENIKIEAELYNEKFVPEDMILYENKLAVISTQYVQHDQYNTEVTIYDIGDKTKPKVVEQYILYSKYYTSRCINGQLIVICSEQMREKNDRIVTYYTENDVKKDIGLDNIKYIRNRKERYQTILSSINLNKSEDVKVSEYLFDVKNAYVSENNIYLLNCNYSQKNTIWENIKEILKKGIIGFVNNMYDLEYSQYTTIYKFEINDNGNLKFKNKVEEEGITINQFSLDEYNNNLRVALQGDEGSRIVILDKNLQEIGSTEYLSEDETMYSTRFIKDKAYLVTYKNVDPLYVIDLSDPSNPEVLGKLKIPGYSTYLHPYDEDHIIGIGLQTEEIINRDESGKVNSTTTQITGMKMALFDVSDINNPIQISQTIIGDKKTTSAILTNHKALLFSKEKELIAIPVNHYSSDFEVTVDDIYDNDIGKMEKLYAEKNENYIAEGYFVYNVNLKDGFKAKGVIEHEKAKTEGSYYDMYYDSKLLRGLWIKNNLFTVSENMIKVNDLKDLKEISKLKINEK